MINENICGDVPCETPSTTTGAYAAVIPLPRRFARAKSWSRRALAGKLDTSIMRWMRTMERANRG
jgi:hypothetical protein